MAGKKKKKNCHVSIMSRRTDKGRDKKEREAIANQEQREKRKHEREKLKEAASKPIGPLPTRELCQHERIREDIMREREEAMAKFKFYENLEETKKSIGFYGKDKT